LLLLLIVVEEVGSNKGVVIGSSGRHSSRPLSMVATAWPPFISLGSLLRDCVVGWRRNRTSAVASLA
jgi:hypothetical protein